MNERAAFKLVILSDDDPMVPVDEVEGLTAQEARALAALARGLTGTRAQPGDERIANAARIVADDLGAKLRPGIQIGNHNTQTNFFGRRP